MLTYFARPSFCVFRHAALLKAAKWVWESLWSPQRHARIDILDVALFEPRKDQVSGATPTIARWLFTAKDGRVRKKGSGTASLAALKQVLLGKVLRAASGGRRDSREANGTTIGRPFATALFSSGESAIIDEAAWTTLVLGQDGGDSIAAMTALDRGECDELKRVSHQRLACEYKLKINLSSPTGVKDAVAMPPQAVTTTYVVVSPSLLREGEQQDGGQTRGRRVSGICGDVVDRFLVSRVKASNQEVETKLRRIVQWVQEVRQVRVVSMTATFTMLPTSGAATPGAWLERVLNVCMVQNESETGLIFTGDQQAQPIENDAHRPSEHGNPSTTPPPHTQGQLKTSPGIPSCQPAPTILSCRYDELRDRSDQRAVVEVVQSARGTTLDGRSGGPAPAPISAVSASNVKSVGQILSAATKLALSAGELATSDPGQDFSTPSDKSISGSLAETAASWRRRGRSTLGTEVSRGIAYDKCTGDFCAFQGCSVGSLPTRDVNKGEVVANSSDLDWTDVGVSREGASLVEVARQRSSLDLVEADIHFSITYKSIVAARIESSQGHDSYWGESLRKFWKKRGPKAADLKALNPAVVYREVSETQNK